MKNAVTTLKLRLRFVITILLPLLLSPLLSLLLLPHLRLYSLPLQHSLSKDPNLRQKTLNQVEPVHVHVA